jgi:acetolactate synthase-1/2/3 large subunit
LTGVANAFTDCAPMVAIGGSSPRVFLGMEAFQEIDQVAVFKPVTKYAARIYDAKRIPDMVATALREATSGRPGPVYLDLPGDVLGEKVEEDAVVYPPRGSRRRARSAIRTPSARPSRCWRAPSAR